MVPFLGVFLDTRGFTSQDIGELMALITFARIIGPNLWATIADKSGKSLLVLQAGSLVTFLSFLLLFVLQGFWGITLAFSLVMMFWTAIVPQLESITLSSVRGEAKIYSNIRLWGSVGFIVTSIVAGSVVDLVGAEGILVVSSLVLLALFIFTLFIRHEKAPKAKLEQQATMRSAVFNRTFVFFILSSVLLQFSFAPYYSFFALYMQDLGYQGQEIGWLVSIGVAAEVIIFLVAGKLLNRNGVKNTLLMCMMATALRWWLTAEFAANPAVLMIAQAIHALSFGLAHAAAMQFIHQHFGSAQQSRGQAIYVSVSFGVGGAAGSYISGFMWQQGAGAWSTFMMASACAFAAGLLVLFMASGNASPSANTRR